MVNDKKKKKVICREVYIGPWTENIYECTLEDNHEGYHYDEHAKFDWNIKRAGVFGPKDVA